MYDLYFRGADKQAKNAVAESLDEGFEILQELVLAEEPGANKEVVRDMLRDVFAVADETGWGRLSDGEGGKPTMLISVRKI